MSTADIVDELLADYIEQSGVKGMKWGVRKAVDSTGDGASSSSKPLSARAQKKVDKAGHKSWQKDANSAKTASAVYNEAARTMNPVLKKINKDPAYKNMDRKTQQQYDAVVGTIFNQHMAQASVKLTTKSFGDAIGTRAMVYQFDRNSGYFSAKEHVAVIEHSESEFPRFKAILDKDGYVIGSELDEALVHTTVDLILEDYLEHYGIKGQKWGVRRTPKQLGKGSEDFERAFAARTKATTQGRHTLSNKELQDAVTRMNLERQYSMLSTPSSPASKQFVVGVLKDVGRETLKSLLKDQVKGAGTLLGNVAAKAVTIPLDSIGTTK